MGTKVVEGHGAKTGRVFINGAEFCVEEYDWKEVADEEETTNSCSAGKAEFEYGNTHVEGSVRATWDISANPFNDPPELRAGQGYRMLLYVHSQPGVSPSGPVLEVDNMKINNPGVTKPQKGKIGISFDFKSSGPYSLPTQASDSSSGI